MTGPSKKGKQTRARIWLARDQLIAELNREPTASEVASRCGLTRQRVTQIYAGSGIDTRAGLAAKRAETKDRADALAQAGGAPSLGGWRLLADLERREDATTGEQTNVVREVRGETCPEKYRDAPDRCLHCGANVQRRRTFILAHDDGRTTHVGSLCLADFLGEGALAAWLRFGRIDAGRAL